MAVAVALCACLCSEVRAEDAGPPGPAAEGPCARSALRPRAAFAQLGVAHEVSAVSAGALWGLPLAAWGPRWSAYVEASISRWQSRSEQPSQTGVLTQLALVSVLRYRFDEGRSPWFAEGGIGATVTSSIYRGHDSRFSTSFNFGDHVGVGSSFGAGWKSEIALRVEHFSNAGIKHPNPGKNFIELRYVHYFD